MFTTSIKHYLVHPNKIQIPDEGLGEFVSGYTNENKPFNWTNILWNILPLGGQFMFFLEVGKHWSEKLHPSRILIYKNGFIKQKLDRKKRVIEESIVDFNRINGIMTCRTRHYRLIYGIRKYDYTEVEILVMDDKYMEESVLEGKYKNENEIDGEYNFFGYASNAVSNAWFSFSLDNFNNEYSTKGFGSFSTTEGVVLVGKDFIKVNNDVVSSGFKYAFDSGRLYLYPNAAEGGHFKQKTKPIEINVAEMYNREVFLLAIKQIHGIV